MGLLNSEDDRERRRDADEPEMERLRALLCRVEGCVEDVASLGYAHWYPRKRIRESAAPSGSDA